MNPHPELIDSLLYGWHIDHADAETNEDIKIAHVEFERIHPFEDGNGRVGRIVMNWQRLKAGLHVLVIREVDKLEYYKWFADEQL